ncbi:MAG: 4-hydroxy-3-methylbut-2-enyl diphosphate reductase [Coriobacteriaceae bacterium]|nr:4-hydroxy-3-methylbut-2-enyl diphosphate reductase [Coriobacteriaceae bacterium]
MRVEVARHAGVCYGVERALKMAEEAAADGHVVRTLGPLIHNPQAVAALRSKGVEVAACLDEAVDGTLVIRTHGVDPAIIENARERGLDVVDATCPFVTKAHEAAETLVEGGYSVVIVGEPDHPEVEGIVAHARGEAIIAEEVADLPAKLPSRKLGVVVQTTQSAERLGEIVAALLPRASELRVFNTICSATAKRQEAAHELAGRVDVVVVVGGRNSGNTTRLAEICRAVNPRAHHVETADEVDASWFDGAAVVGVTAGASTPDAQIAGVIAAIEALA